jgi:TolB-like protein/DNA-binding winged helix-turn-helix (wHTH) protein/Tfp pilus assembly protein PilF
MGSPNPGANEPGNARYRFGDIVVDAAAHTISRAGMAQAVEPKSFAVLLALLQRPGELIARDDLLDRVWGHRHVTPGVLTRAIAQLRHALDDDSQRPRYIQTQHAVGYRFVGELQPKPVAAAAAAAMVVEAGPVDVAPTSLSLEVRRQAGAAEDDARPQTSARSAIAPRPARNRSLRTWGAAALLLGVAAAALWAWNERATAPPAPADASIAILPFSSLGSDRSDDYFAEGLAVEMHDALAGVEGLKVAAQLSPASANLHGADVKALGRKLGVATVLDASVRRAGARVRINARLSDCNTGYTLWSHSYDRELSDVFATQSEIADEVVRSLLGALPGGREALAQRLTPTKNVAAFDAYLKGLQRLLRSGGSGEEQAIGFFNQALAADRGFARAQAGICRAEAARFETRRDADAFDRAQAACARAAKMDAGLSEVNLALAELHYARGDIGKAIEHYAKAEVDPARRPSVYVGMAMVHADQGRQDQAQEYFKRALALRPGDAYIHSLKGYYRYLAGDMTAAIASYRRAIELQPGDADLWNMLGLMHLNAGDNVSASRALQRSIAIKPHYAALSNLGELKYQAGDYAAAAELHRRATVLEPNDFLPWGNLGDALLARPATAEQARAAYSEAAERAQRYVDIKSDDAKALAGLGWYRANLGQAQLALELVKRSEALGSEPTEVALFNAQTLVTLGDLDQARQRVAAARAAGMPKNRIATNVVLRRANIVSPMAEDDRADSRALGSSEGHPPGG